ncbi:hypothetical protein [Halalkalibacter oceani]
MNKKVCAFCSKEDSTDKMIDQAGIYDGFEQWVHILCYEDLKDKANQ